MQPLNDLIPEDTTIVVLDTSPARNLAYANTPPEWVSIFSEMMRSGYSFSLADNAFAELFSQMKSGAITAGQAEIMLEHLKIFLNKDLPIFPGKRDISTLIGADEATSTWSVAEMLALSSRGWEFLIHAHTTSVENPQSAAEELQFEREAWFGIFEKLSECEATGEPLNEYEHKQLDIAFAHYDDMAPGLLPPLSIRSDLQLRLLWRQYVRSKKDLEPYDPKSPKKRNDGIDFDLFNYFLLPALVVATDRGFFEKVTDIKSFQKDWFYKPEVLAQAWVDGQRPRPTWPQT